MPLQTAPCQPWPIDLECCQGLPADLDAAVVAKWQQVASFVLWAFSGRRVGLCEVTVRPCKQSCIERLGIDTRSGSTGPYTPYTRNGKWYNATCGCTDSCSCTELCEVYLPGPVHSIVEITIDGQVIHPSTYRVDAAGRLVRQSLCPDDASGEGCVAQCWPECQDMAAPAGGPGTFVVTYRWGIEPDAAAQAAATELTCEMVKAACPGKVPSDCRCRLPGNVQRVVRQNVTVDLITEPTTIFKDGRTGLPTVDMWLAAVNPHGLTRPGRVLSPDFRRPRVTTWP